MEKDLLDSINDVRNIHNNFRIIGSGVSGNLKDGFCLKCPEGQAPSVGGMGGGGGVSPPPTPTGACCRGEVCTGETQESCESSGGTYQGDGVPCSPNPCSLLPGGFCCIRGACGSIDNETCLSLGGTIVDTCTPNPCPGACCIEGVCFENYTPTGCTDAGGEFMGGICGPSTCDEGSCQCCCDRTGSQGDYYCYVSNLTDCPTIQGAYRCDWCNYPKCVGDIGNSTCEGGGGCCRELLDEDHNPFDPPQYGCFNVLYHICFENAEFALAGFYYGDHITCDHEDAPPCPPESIMKLGDAVATVATPVARVLEMDCVDPATGQLKPESKCAGRIQTLNDWGDAAYDWLFQPKGEK